MSRPERLLYTVEEFIQLIGIGRSMFYTQLRDGRIKARKIGSRTVITVEDAMSYVRELPYALPGPSRPRPKKPNAYDQVAAAFDKIRATAE